MDNDLRTKLTEYYKQSNIYPLDFDCEHKECCNQYANQRMTEAKMSMVGSHYAEKFPRLVIVSLDPPFDEKGTFVLPKHRTTEYVTWFHEHEDYRIDRPGVHWAMTQIIVKDILVMFGYHALPGSAVVLEKYARRKIENVTTYFAHVNVAKCCMNNEAKGQAAWQVHQKCGHSYLITELGLLHPDILISQGKDANEILGQLFKTPGIEDALPAAKMIQIEKKQTLWLPMDHPSRHLADIRQRWPFYVRALKKWKDENFTGLISTSSNEVISIDLTPVVQLPPLSEVPNRSIDPKLALGQSGLSDFGLYKCLKCGRMVMGYEKEVHVNEKHHGEQPVWKKMN